MDLQRIRWIDMAKGYGMLCVILSHLQYWFIGDYVYTFHIPLFFFLSGYVFKTYDSFGTFFKKKCKTMVIPYFLYGFILMLSDMFFQYGFGKFGWRKTLNELFVQKRAWTLWFLACLIVLELVYYLLLRICRENLIVISVITLAMTVLGVLYFQHWNGDALPWNVDTVLTAILFFHVGYVLKETDLLEYVIHCHRRWMLWACAVGFFCLHFMVNLWNLNLSGEHLEMFYMKYGNPVLTYLDAFLGISFVALISSRTTNPLIRYMGKNSLTFFALHQGVAIPLLKVMTWYTGWLKDGYNWKDHLIYMVGYTVLVIVIMTLITECIHLVKGVRNKLQC